MPSCDVVVVGGGTAGCAAALSMRRHGIDRVVMVERGPRPGRRIGECIPPDTRRVLTQLGLWEDFVAQRHDPCPGSCSAWGSAELGFNDFLFNPHGFAWHLDRPRFDTWLCDRAVRAGVDIRRGLHFSGVEHRGDANLVLKLTATDGSSETLRAHLAVDATGSGAYVARALGARRLVHDQLSCLTSYAGPADAHMCSQLTLLEAAEYGWWYAARLPGGRVAVAVASDPALLQDRSIHTRHGWNAAVRRTCYLARQLGTDAGGERIVARRIRSSILDRVSGPDWLAIGDAACSYDPLMARGIHDALNDGVEAGRLASARLGGDTAALDSHRVAVVRRFDEYLAVRNWFYRLENRWPEASFWVNRRGRASTLAAFRVDKANV
jgi:flavin-dependent dehydrogenase